MGKWNDALITSGIYKVMAALNLDRMPSNTEMNMVNQNRGLSCAISKHGGFYKWADKLNIEMKNCETQMGKGFEKMAINILNSKGFITERMSTRYPYDILVNSNISVDVKAAKAYISRGCRVHTVGINKKYATCDLYLIFALDEERVVEKTFIIPGVDLKLTSLNFGAKSKYNIYLDRWDFFQMYDEFYKKLHLKS